MLAGVAAFFAAGVAVLLAGGAGRFTAVFLTSDALSESLSESLPELSATLVFLFAEAFEPVDFVEPLDAVEPMELDLARF